jgi:site-specific DNA-methyltransferase (adenine-specific)
MVRIENGDSAEVLKSIESNSIDALVTDPPAGIEFMGKEWDRPGGIDDRQPTDDGFPSGTAQFGRAKVRHGTTAGYSNGSQREAFIDSLTPIFRECFRAMKPGAHGLVWALPRTSHWTTTALEDAGFEVRDIVMHLFGTGFPKSLNVEKAGAGPAWRGWGTALKPAAEHWILVRKSLAGTVAENVQEHGTGALNIDASRIGTEARFNPPAGYQPGGNSYMMGVHGMPQDAEGRPAVGRFPSHLILDEEAAAMLDAQSGESISRGVTGRGAGGQHGTFRPLAAQGTVATPSDAGGASRFFYVAKASKADKGTDNKHPTVKNTALMDYLIRLITPPGGVVLDPFMGSGSTGVSAVRLGHSFIGIERETSYFEIAERRISAVAPIVTSISPQSPAMPDPSSPEYATFFD